MSKILNKQSGQHFIAGLFLGLPWTLSFSPFELWWVGLACVLLLPVVLVGLPKLPTSPPGSAGWAMFLGGFGFGLSAFCIGIHWLYISLHTYGGLPGVFAILSVFLFSAYLALFSGFASWVYSRTSSCSSKSAFSVTQPVVWAGAWTFFEWLRGTLFTGFAWLSLGDTLVDSPFEFLLPWLGSYGALYLLIFAGSCLIQVLCMVFSSRRAEHTLSVSLHALCVIVCLGAGVLLKNLEPSLKVTPAWKVVGIQTNVDQSIKFDPDMIVSNMEKVFGLGLVGLAKLPEEGTLIFPETVTPLLWTDQPQKWTEAFRDFGANRSGDVVMGAALQDGQDYYNSIIHLSGDEQGKALEIPQNRHAKRHLVPFGEFIPTGFHWFVRMLNMPMGEFTRGHGEITPFLTQSNAVVSTVCYEDTFSGEFAQLLKESKQEATVLLNLSNLAWFGQSWALEQHAQMGRTRSSEHRKPSVRVTNTGLSGVIDERGQWIHKIPPGTEQSWPAQIQGRIGLTPFAKVGENLWFCLWMVALVAFVFRFRAMKAYNSGLSGNP